MTPAAPPWTPTAPARPKKGLKFHTMCFIEARRPAVLQRL